ncbi:hypothetical protein HYDPIDRAFT_91565 [Hydnomerulius pinastri MD-312]|uniref:DUF2264 domain-containing protein n=1 Tax=Hydnomerulius pinastri MD-312 TaxID=994086 RepID=A0A0C9WF27_9AGAM|nr:hypothetical protein HYDPIDRAFT_91565 [Hydnomerulius pinastri MD-312]
MTADQFASTRPWVKNPLKSKSDVAAFLRNVLDPLAGHTSPGGARIHLSHTGTHFDDVAAQLEGFSRPIWALASLLAGGGSYDGTHRWVRGFASGTNPTHPEFWGNMRDRDQRMVECSAIGYSLAVAREQLWDPLDEQSKQHLGAWLGGMNDKEMPNTNWLWFRVFANLGLSRVGSPKFDAARMKADLDHLDTFYIGDGWSRDGPEGVVQLDYYSSSFAIQVAQLVYAKIMEKDDPVRAEEYRNRGRKFALDFIHYFDQEGNAIPFGRSMVYRCAMSAFWSALSFSLPEPPAPLTWGQLKGLQLRNIRAWMKTPGAWAADGTLTLGYCYPNMNMLESYNSGGSVYWACKAFICLALPDSHPYWTSEEEPYPSHLVGTTWAVEKPLHILTNVGGHTYLLSSGQQCSYPVKQSAAKYGKFAYSSAFGYSVPVASLTLEEHAIDSALALSEDNGEIWKVRRETKEARIEGGKWLRSMWYPWSGVEVETWLVPPSPSAPLWHLRIHRIRSSRKLLTAEGGWAIYGQREDERALEPESPNGGYGTLENGPEARALSKAGVSGIVDLSSPTSRTGQAMRTDANSNLIVPRAVMPTLMGKNDGNGQDDWLVTAVFGLPNVEGVEGPRDGWQAEWLKRPEIPTDIAALMTR